MSVMMSINMTLVMMIKMPSFFWTEYMLSCPFENFLCSRFNIKQINEFYGSTEGNCSVGNFSNK